MKPKFTDLKKAIKDLNDAGILETKLKSVGIKADVLQQDFMDTVADLIEEDGHTDSLPESVTEMYDFINDAPEKTEKKEKPAKKEAKNPAKKPAKKEAKKKTIPTETIKRGALVKCFKDLIDVLGLEDEIEDEEGNTVDVPMTIPKGAKIDDLKAKILEASAIIEEGDEVSKDTQVVIDLLEKERADTESSEDRQKRMVEEVIEEEKTEKPAKKEKPVKKEKGTKPEKKIKEEKKEKPVKKIVPKKEKKITKTQFVADLIEKGTHTANEIIEIANEEMSIPKSSVTTMINHGKSEKKNGQYKPFKGRLIIIDNKKRVCFEV